MVSTGRNLGEAQLGPFGLDGLSHEVTLGCQYKCSEQTAFQRLGVPQLRWLAHTNGRLGLAVGEQSLFFSIGVSFLYLLSVLMTWRLAPTMVNEARQEWNTSFCIFFR